MHNNRNYKSIYMCIYKETKSAHAKQIQLIGLIGYIHANTILTLSNIIIIKLLSYHLKIF